MIISVFGKIIFGKIMKNPREMGGRRGKISPKFWQKVYFKKFRNHRNKIAPKATIKQSHNKL
jgi:hypothetical protein